MNIFCFVFYVKTYIIKKNLQSPDIHLQYPWGKRKKKNQNERYTDLNEFKIEKKKQLIKLPTRHK